ncbi:MAG: hypothetical protein ACYCZ0_02085 [Minisyncoccota bacterium]
MKTFKGLLSKWWFWGIAVIVLLPLVWFLSGYRPHEVRMWQVEKYRDMAKAGYAEMQQEQEALEAAYRKDTYGGSTPEETLELFIEALEAKDYELAVKYFVIEKQEEEKGNLNMSATRGFIDDYLNVLLMRHVVKIGTDGEGSDIEFFNAAGNQVHFGQMILNPFTKKWKIAEL